MGKRSNFERRERDFYPTPREAVLPLVPHLRDVRTFAEPCCGDRALVRHLESVGLRCTYAGDIATGQDALACESFDSPVITNTPWRRDLLHPMIKHFIRCASFAWLLFDADWAHTKQSRPLIPHCSLILPIGRVKWIADSRDTGKDNAAWYRFDLNHIEGPTLLPFRCDSAVGPSRACRHCREHYRSQRSDARFCSSACRQSAYRQRLAVTHP